MSAIVRAALAVIRANKPCPDCRGDWTRNGVYIPHDKSCPRRITL